MKELNLQGVINGLKNLSMALGVLEKLPERLAKDAINNIIPFAIQKLQLLAEMEKIKEVKNEVS